MLEFVALCLKLPDKVVNVQNTKALLPKFGHLTRERGASVSAGKSGYYA